MRVNMVTEGTYPHAHGGVSVWCDQLVRGMSEHRFGVVAITATGRERPVWTLPENVDDVVSLPLWAVGPSSTSAAEARRWPVALSPSRRRPYVHPVVESAVLRLGHALVEPELAVASRRFRSALRTWASLAPRYDLETALVSERFIAMLLERWSVGVSAERWGGRSRGVPTVADAVTATRLIAHALRPLSHEPRPADVTHLVANGIAGLVGLAGKWRHGTPYVLSEHGVYLRERYLSFGRAAYSWPVKWLLLRFHRLLASAVYSEAALVAPGNVYNQRWETADGVPANLIRTVYNGVDSDEFSVAQDEPSTPTLTWVGRVDPIKDLETLIRAFALVAERVPGARLRLFGGTPAGSEDYARSLVALAAELGVDDTVTFEGRIDVIRDAYVAGNVVVLSSISEGFPYTVIEAMSCGRATVCTDVGGVAEAVGDAGLVVPPRRPELFADACTTLLLDHEARRAHAERARVRVIELFTLDRSLDAFRTIYDDVVRNRDQLELVSA